MLRPVETPTREIKKLDGLWAFSLDRENCGIDQRWWESVLQESRAIAVPGSFNDQFADADIRNYVGNVWYQREVFIPKGWAGQRIVLRFDAVTHYGKVWVNNQEVMEHQGGYTPFEADVTPYVIAGKSVRITVCVNNELNWQTIPPGMVITDENGKKKQSYFHDFFNYAGIHRSVMLYTTPNTWVDDITVVTHVAQDCNHASVDWQVVANGDVSVELRDADQQVVATGQGTSGTLQVVNPHLWQPGEGYLYELCVTAKSQTECDIYPLRVGIRSVAVKGEQFLINHKPFYFTGFGRHEDADLRGKGFDNVLMVHDHALMDWIGANSYRTSHYPYAEEMLDWADEHGIVVIDETAAVGFNLSLGIGFEAGIKPKELYSEEAVNGETQQAHFAGMVLYFICFKSTRENVVRIVAQPSLKISLQTLKRNRPLFMLCIGALCVLISTFAVSASSLFYVRYVLNDTGLFTVLVLVQNLVGTVASAPLVPGMVARIGKKNTFLIGALLGSCGYLLFFWVSVWSLPVALVALAIASIGQGVTMTVMWALEADTVEYGEYLTGVRIEGLTYSLFSFTRKCGQAIGGSIPAFILGLSGYIANQVQAPEVIMGIRTSIALVPCGFMLLAFVIIWFYPLTDKKFKEIVVEIDNRKKMQQQLIRDITN